MKNLLLSIIAFFLVIVVQAQYNPTLHNVQNKATGIAQAAPVDARSYFYDANLFIYRPYQSPAEALTYLNITKYRVGHFPIFINVGGTLQSGGTFVGGVITEYWFANGTTNSDLVAKSIAPNIYVKKVIAVSPDTILVVNKVDSNYIFLKRLTLTNTGAVGALATFDPVTNTLNIPPNATADFSGLASIRYVDSSFDSKLFYYALKTDIPDDYMLKTFRRSDTVYRVTSKGDTLFAYRDSIGTAGVSYTDAQARATQSALAPLSYNSTTGVHSADTGRNAAQLITGGVFGKVKDSLGLLIGTKQPSGSYEGAITPGTTLQYWRGDKTFQTLNTAAVPESGNFYFTDARARLSLALTTTGSGAATYNNITGALNIPTASASATPGLNAVTGIDSSSAHYTSFTKGLSIGTAPATLATLKYQTFASAIPAGWTKGGTFTTAYSSKVTLSGGNGFYNNFLQYDSTRFAYEKLDFTLTIIPITKATGNALAIMNASNAALYNVSPVVKIDLSNGVDSGRIFFATDSTAIKTATSYSSNTSFNTGDTLLFTYHKDGWYQEASLLNKRTGLKTIANAQEAGFSYLLHTGGKWQIVPVGGTQDILSVKWSSNAVKSVPLYFGTSELSSNATAQFKRFADRIHGSNGNKYNVMGMPGLRADFAAALASDIIALQPSYIVLDLGVNSRNQAIDTTTFKTNIDSVVQPLLRAGFSNIAMLGLVPSGASGNPGGATDNWNTATLNYANAKGFPFIDIRTPLLKGGNALATAYNSDDVHTTDSGHIVIAYTVTQKVGDKIRANLVGDTISNAYAYNLPSGNYNASLLGKTDNGAIVVTPYKVSDLGNAVLNRSSTTSSTTGNAVQKNAAVYVDGPLQSDSALLVAGQQGLNIGFPTGANNSTVKANIDITNAVNPSTLLQLFDNITGAGNIKMIASSANKVKNNIGKAISGNNNTLINSDQGATLSGNTNTIVGDYNAGVTSGSNNVGIGTGALVGVTTQGNNVQILSGGSTDGVTGNVANSIAIGNNFNHFWEPIQSNEAIFYAPTYWFGGRKYGTQTISINVMANAGTNVAGNDWIDYNSRGTGTALAGRRLFAVPVSGSTGTTSHSTFSTVMQYDLSGVVIGKAAAGSTATALTKDASALVDMQSITQGILVPRMTKAQRDAIVSPADGLIIYQTDNTIGFKFRENGAWVKHTVITDP